MEQFLRRRGIGENILHKLKAQRIDEDAINGMTDTQLSEFFPEKGDRYALRDFLKNGDTKTKAKKASLMDRLRERLKSNDSSNADNVPTTSKQLKKNAQKQMHKVDLGWYHYEEARQMFVQVREKAGGGKRTVSLGKEMDKAAIIDQCVKLFFPEGESQHGSLKDMIVNLTDFQLKTLPDTNTTIGDMIDRAKLQKLRFYLNTKLRRPPTDCDGKNPEVEKISDPDPTPLPKLRKKSIKMSSTAMKQTTSSFDMDTSDSDSSPLPSLKTKSIKMPSNAIKQTTSSFDMGESDSDPTPLPSLKTKSIKMSSNEMQKTTSSKDKNDKDESDSDKSSLPKFNITSTKMSSIAMKPTTSSNDKDDSTDTKNEQMFEKQKLSNKADEETKRYHPSEIMTIATSEIMTVDIENSLWNNQLEMPDPCLDEADVQPAWEDSLNEIAFTHTLPIKAVLSDPKEFKITVHRGHVLKELIELFKCNPDVNFETDIITSQIVLPNGDIEQAYDSGGVMRDMLTEFWGDFYEQCTMGSILKIPCLRHDFEAPDWKAVAKILAMGWILQKILPIRLAPSFLNSCLFGMTLSTDILREEFLQFVTPGDGKILTDALKDIDSVDKDDLLEVLSIHECKVKTTKDNIASVIDQIAHKELVQEPSFIRECFFEILISYEFAVDVKSEFQKIIPTSKKLLSILDCKEAESDSFKYLKRFIRENEADMQMLRTMLRYLTASDLMLYNSEGNYHRITVRIVDIDGIAAHTCGRTLDLPRTYESYPIFKCELNAVLRSNVWVMDFA